MSPIELSWTAKKEMKKDQTGLDRSASWFQGVKEKAYRVPGGQRVVLQGPRGPRGRPTRYQGVKGKALSVPGSQGVGNKVLGGLGSMGGPGGPGGARGGQGGQGVPGGQEGHKR